MASDTTPEPATQDQSAYVCVYCQQHLAGLSMLRERIATLERQLAEAREDATKQRLDEAQICLDILQHDEYLIQVYKVEQRVKMHQAAIDAERRER